jgi:hypothetical protein
MSLPVYGGPVVMGVFLGVLMAKPLTVSILLFRKEVQAGVIRMICDSQLVIYSLTAFTVCATMCHSI